MFTLITEAQKQEIEELVVDHHDAIVAAMADMYKDGIIKGAFYCILGVTAAFLVEVIKIKHHKKGS